MEDYVWQMLKETVETKTIVLKLRYDCVSVYSSFFYVCKVETHAST